MDPLAFLLGARGKTAKLLSDYIAGYALGIAPQALLSLLVSITSFNNDLLRIFGIYPMFRNRLWIFAD